MIRQFVWTVVEPVAGDAVSVRYHNKVSIGITPGSESAMIDWAEEVNGGDPLRDSQV
jgi:hypothetical protein